MIRIKLANASIKQLLGQYWLGASKAGSLILIAIGFIAAFIFYEPYEPPPGVNSNFDLKPAREVEFTALFEIDAPLANLARPGHYTVVEVYIDSCMWCREFDAAFVPFQRRRADVAWVRVHHPGVISYQFDGRLDSDPHQEYQIIDARMESYGLCGTPHVEVYGPDREPLALDSCASRAGTQFMWNWIKHETGTWSKRSGGWESWLELL